MLEYCEAQLGKMQGAAVGGNPKQTTLKWVGDTGRRSRISTSDSRI